MRFKTDPFLLELEAGKKEELHRILSRLSSSDESILKLTKDIAAFTYSEERQKSDVIENRAFGLMQFAKVGLTIIIGIAGLITTTNVHNTPFRESLIFLLSIAAAFLAKLFYRGLNVVKIGSFFRPQFDAYVKPNEKDIYETQDGETYMVALKQHIASTIWYLQYTSNDNHIRSIQRKCCYVNSFGFLIAFLAFFVLSMVHLLEPSLTLNMPEHRIIGAILLALALTADNIAQSMRLGWFDIEPAPAEATTA